MCKMGDNGGDQKLEGITEVQDSDVLCGRGGAALRHAGNQTYRKLVSLNKGLYITCLKTEKLKISRSIVAAIREKKGRFLEKDTASGTWYDIGDKKAVEKTSQALREGQPKLRQQIVEMGGGAAGAASLIESQFGAQAAAAVGAAGLYPQQGGQMQGGSMMNRQQMNPGNPSMRQQMMNQQGYGALQQQQMRQQHMQQQMQQQQQMSGGGGLPFDDIQNDLMSRLSLHEDTSGMPQQQGMNQRQASMGPPSMQVRQMMGNNMGPGMSVSDSQIPMMNEYGGYGTGQMNANGGIPMDNSFRAAMRDMGSPPSSVGGSMHSTMHTLDFSSMHSLDQLNGMSGHSMGLASNHSTMGPPSSHLPTMSSMSRQQQIDERYPQNLGLDPQSMNQSFRRQGQDNRPQPPPQPSRVEQGQGQQQQQQHVGNQGLMQQRMQAMQQKANLLAVQGARMYNGMPKTSEEFDPVGAFSPDGSRGGYADQGAQQQQEPPQPQQPSRTTEYADTDVIRQNAGGYPQEQHPGAPVASRSYDDQGRNAASGRAYDGPIVEKQRLRDPQPPDRNISSSTEGISKNQSQFSLTQSMASITSTSTNPSVLRPEARQKMDRRNMFAKMKFTRPPSIRDSKMGLNAPSTHSQYSTGDGMPDIHMVESQLSLHSTMSNMTDGASTRNVPAAASSSNSAKGAPFVETAKVVDHSARADNVDLLAVGSKHSLMSGLSRISDHSLNDASIFSSLSKQIGNVSTRSMAMSEISVIDVAEQEDEDDSNHEAAESNQAS